MMEPVPKDGKRTAKQKCHRFGGVKPVLPLAWFGANGSNLCPHSVPLLPRHEVGWAATNEQRKTKGTIQEKVLLHKFPLN